MSVDNQAQRNLPATERKGFVPSPATLAQRKLSTWPVCATLTATSTLTTASVLSAVAAAIPTASKPIAYEQLAGIHAAGREAEEEEEDPLDFIGAVGSPLSGTFLSCVSPGSVGKLYQGYTPPSHAPNRTRAFMPKKGTKRRTSTLSSSLNETRTPQNVLSPASEDEELFSDREEAPFSMSPPTNATSASDSFFPGSSKGPAH
jgi:hypothetical protein